MEGQRSRRLGGGGERQTSWSTGKGFFFDSGIVGMSNCRTAGSRGTERKIHILGFGERELGVILNRIGVGSYIASNFCWCECDQGCERK